MGARSQRRERALEQAFALCEFARHDDRPPVAEASHAAPLQKPMRSDPVVPAGDAATQPPVGFRDDLDVLELDGQRVLLVRRGILLRGAGAAEAVTAGRRLPGSGGTEGRSLGASVGPAEHTLPAASQPSTPARVERTRYRVPLDRGRHARISTSAPSTRPVSASPAPSSVEVRRAGWSPGDATYTRRPTAKIGPRARTGRRARYEW